MCCLRELLCLTTLITACLLIFLVVSGVDSPSAVVLFALIWVIFQYLMFFFLCVYASASEGGQQMRSSDLVFIVVNLLFGAVAFRFLLSSRKRMFGV